MSGRVALVTGSTQGIGLGIALRLASEGAAVALNARNIDTQSEQARAQVLEAGGRCELFVADVSDPAACSQLVLDVNSRFGALDILVNNAGIERHAAMQEVTERDWDAVLDTNLKGPFFLSQAFARIAKERNRGGCIINISSVHEELPFSNFSPYCASKGGLKMIMRTLALELAPLGITVNNVAPGAIRTPINSALLDDKVKLAALLAQIPAGRLGEPQDVAGVVAFLASEDARYITGTTVFVEAGVRRKRCIAICALLRSRAGTSAPDGSTKRSIRR
jgi:glucose 1-dehydrogenase